MKIMILLLILTMQMIAAPDIGQQYHMYLWARYNQAQENHAIAQTCYNLLLKYSPSPHIYPSFLEFLFNTGQYSIVVQLTPVVERMLPLDVQTKLMFAQSLQEVGLITEAITHFEQLMKEHTKNPEVMYAAAHAYLVSNKPHDALKILDTYLSQASSHDHALAFHFMKAQIFTLQQKYTAARSSLQTILKIYPHFDKAWLLMGLLDELDGNHGQAIERYQQYLKIAGSNQIVEEQIMRLKMQQKK
jgi:hypothetical protein